MIFNMIAVFICGMFLVMFFGTTIVCAIALMKSCFDKPFEWENSLALCMVLFLSVFELIGTYSIITIVGTPA